jgi:hypothetical protein
MLENKSTPQSRSKLVSFRKPPQSDALRVRALQLQTEIDRLALLLHEVKKQSDRIQAAADAVGDALFSRMEDEIVPATLVVKGKKASTTRTSQSCLRSRTDKVFPLPAESGKQPANI